MNWRLFYIFFSIPVYALFGQVTESPISETKKKDSIAVVDVAYREDQFYASVTYNLLANKLDGVSQSGFSSGFHFGFIRDMPINKRRNVAIGLGLGLSANSYNQTLQISEVNGTFNYTVLDDDLSFSKNKFTTYLLEVPLEFRWRTSTAVDFDFWRIYTGLKLGYVFYNTSKYAGEPSDIKLTNIDELNVLQYGLTLSVGYSNINFHMYYALNPIFDDSAKLNSTNDDITLSAVKIGLMFYIL
ncbi:porin family protein [Psychroserpens sp.]|uniref:porin family protein n=1 Tax=Psychroserpens sp. TaxID=2020870 RepID=UPI003C74ED89